jgi:hypothetical protein
MFRKLFAPAAVVAVVLASAAPAFAHDDDHHHRSEGDRILDAAVAGAVIGLERPVAPAPVYVQPAPVVVQQPSTVVCVQSDVYGRCVREQIVTPAPVVAPQPVYVQPAPVVVTPVYR